MTDQAPRRVSKHQIRHVITRTLSKAWDDSIFSESAQAAFWQVLSLPPLLLGLLGSLAYIAPMFGPDTLPVIEHRLISAANSFFSPSVVNEIIAPTITDIVQRARGEVVSLGFVVSLWAGSSAISAFVDSVVEAHRQTPLRHPVRQRFFALGIYVVMLIVALGGCRSSRWVRSRSPSGCPTAGIACCSTATTPCSVWAWWWSSPSCTASPCPSRCLHIVWCSAPCWRQRCSC